MKKPLISIVIPTKNSEKTIRECLESIKGQTYQNYEVIVVDAFSKDATKKITGEYSGRYFTSSTSLPGARNFGFSKAKGDIFISIDSDMILEKTILEEAVEKMPEHKVLIIPEIGYGTNFLSKCKNLEKKCYMGDSNVESARIFSREVHNAVNGYNEDLYLGEDRDFHCRIKKKFKIGRIKSKVFHNTRHLTLISDLKKTYAYGKSLPKLIETGHSQRMFSNPGKIFFINNFSKLKSEPVTAAGLLIVRSMEYAAGIAGFIVAKVGR